MMKNGAYFTVIALFLKALQNELIKKFRVIYTLDLKL